MKRTSGVLSLLALLSFGASPPGFADTVLDTLLAEAPASPRTQADLARRRRLPPWLGRRALHRSHQSALVRKDPVHYRPFFPNVPDDLPYVWPPGHETIV